MEKLASQVLQSTISQNRKVLVQDGAWERFQGFLHAIDWREPWIAGTLAAYVALLTVVVATRRRPNVQLVIFVAVCGAVYCSQYLNDYGAAQWRPLGFTQNYFDKYGIFISLLFSGPLLLIGMFQMLNAFFSSASMLVTAKRAQFAVERRARGAAQVVEAAAAGATGGIAAAPAAVSTSDTAAASNAAASGAARGSADAASPAPSGNTVSGTSSVAAGGAANDDAGASPAVASESKKDR